MATFEKKTWVDRVSEFPTRRTLTDVSTGTAQIVTVSRTEGEITNPGDAFNAQNMNDLENRIDTVVQEMDTNFQAGVDAVYNACVAAGLTPSASTPEAIAAAITTVGGATAVASDIRYGKKAFSQNQMLNGTFQAEEKTITASRSQQIVTPSNASRWLSKVTVNKYPDANGTYTCPSNWNGSPVAGGAGDMGTGNNTRYVNAQNVLAKGHADAALDHIYLDVRYYTDIDPNYRYVDFYLFVGGYDSSHVWAGDAVGLNQPVHLDIPFYRSYNGISKA